jgi:hypothetical protein
MKYNCPTAEVPKKYFVLFSFIFSKDICILGNGKEQLQFFL